MRTDPGLSNVIGALLRAATEAREAIHQYRMAARPDRAHAHLDRVIEAAKEAKRLLGTVMLLVLLAIASPATAKDRELTAAWSGVWADQGQHRCSVVVMEHQDPGLLIVVCQIGRSAVFAETTVPEMAQTFELRETVARFGQPYAGQRVWGEGLLVPMCTHRGAEIWFWWVGRDGGAAATLRARTPVNACNGGARS